MPLRSYDKATANGVRHGHQDGGRVPRGAWGASARGVDLLERGHWDGVHAIGEDEIVREGGGPAHETKNWIAAFAAIGVSSMRTRQRWYRAMPELIAGFGVMFRDDGR